MNRYPSLCASVLQKSKLRGGFCIGGSKWRWGCLLCLGGSQATDTGIDAVGAASLLDSASSLADTYEKNAQNLQNMIRDELLGSGYNSTGNSTDGNSFRRRLLQQQQVAKEATEVMDMVDKLATAGVRDAVDGEDAFEVSSANIQVVSAKRTDPAGTFNIPKEPGATDSAAFHVK